MKEGTAKDIWDQSDDWRGIADARERRRRQNRVHQRAHRMYHYRSLVRPE